MRQRRVAACRCGRGEESGGPPQALSLSLSRLHRRCCQISRRLLGPARASRVSLPPGRRRARRARRRAPGRSWLQSRPSCLRLPPGGPIPAHRRAAAAGAHMPLLSGAPAAASLRHRREAAVLERADLYERAGSRRPASPSRATWRGWRGSPACTGWSPRVPRRCAAECLGEPSWTGPRSEGRSPSRGWPDRQPSRPAQPPSLRVPSSRKARKAAAAMAAAVVPRTAPPSRSRPGRSQARPT